MTEQEKEQQFRDKISELNDKISKISVENAQYYQKMKDLEVERNEAIKEKDKLLSIVADLSKAIANFKN